MNKTILNILCSIVVLLAIPFSLPAQHAAIVKEEFIFKNPPFASCHASTLTQTASGNILCSWFAGTEEGAPDVSIWLASLHDTQWTSPRKIVDAPGVPCWNPVLFTLPSKEILLFYKVGKNPQQWSGLFLRSSDEGVHWSDSTPLPAGVLGPIKNKPLLLSDGTLLCGSSIESWKRWGCWIDITSDQGHTWNKSTPINLDGELFGIIQPTLFFGKDKIIKLLARSHQSGFICTALSHDQGKTWSPAHTTPLPNPDSGIDSTNLTDGRILLVYNHSSEERYPLNIAISQDGGETWNMRLVLEETPGEYSYPSVIQSQDGQVHISYTWNRERIKYVVIDPKLL